VAVEKGVVLAMQRLGRCLRAVALLLPLVLSTAVVATPSATDSRSDCFSEDNDRRISGCTALLGGGGLAPDEEATLLAMRALAYSLKGEYARALDDYDAAIELNPEFSVALNNRAWALYKSGRAKEALADVERALGLSPASPHAMDTRAHIRQELGEPHLAIGDYERAMRFGGERMIKLYQCGLQAQGLYEGRIDGVYSAALRRGLEVCVAKRGCDPLPADEECRKVTS
jgi:tetratricopeptide (TPR) repeat protein